MTAHYYLLAFQSQTQGTPGGGFGGIANMLVPFILIIAIFYFMIMRPQQKRQKERQALLGGVKKGDKVVTAGGMHGTVIGLEEKTVLLQVADNVKLKFERSAISTIMREGETILDAEKK